MNFLLEITAADYADKIIKTHGFGEVALFGLEMVAIGMLAVFGVLSLIWLALVLFEKVFAQDSKPKMESVADEVIAAPTVQSTSDDEIVAVIAAAIAAAESERPGMKFRVVSFNRR